MITRLVVFGGTGDLAGRYLLPGLAALGATGYIDADFDLVCVGMTDWDGRRFHDWALDKLDRHAAEIPAEARRAVAAAARYRRCDIRNAIEVAGVLAGDGPVAVYLALAPDLFPAAIRSLRTAGMSADCRIVLEKPFCEDLATAENLNRLLADLVPEHAVFRVDHLLAMTTVQNHLLHGRLLLNVLVGDPALSIRADEAEEAWRLLAPLLSGWSRDLAPLEEYPAGSLGPADPGRNR